MPENDEDIIREAIEFRQYVEDLESDIRKDFKRNLRFVDGSEQWEPEDRRTRGEDRPAHSINLLEQPVQMVVNQNRTNRPGCKVGPVDQVDDSDTADILQGIIRNIEYSSMADVAYDTAVEYAAAGGFGFIGLTLDYVSPKSLKKAIFIRQFKNPELVFLGPYMKPDLSDMTRAMVLQRFTRDEYKTRFGKDPKEVKEQDFPTSADQMSNWVEDDGSRWVAEYWRVEYEDRILAKVEGFEAEVFLDEIPEAHRPDPKSIKDDDQRKVRYPRVVQRLMDCTTILDETSWAGSQIPIVPVIASERYVDGKRKIKSVISDSITPQRIYNTTRSLDHEAQLNAPTPKWVAAIGAMEDVEAVWKRAKDPSVVVLPYKGHDAAGREFREPSYHTYEPPTQNFAIAAQQSLEEIKYTSASPNAARGTGESDAKSGVAYKQLQQQSGIATSHISGNFGRALQVLYSMMIELIPIVYDSAQQARIIGADQQQKIVKVNQQFRDERTGQVKAHYLSAGTWDVVVSQAPSYQTQQQEAGDFLMQLMSAAPQLFAAMPDLAIKWRNLGPLGDQMAERVTPPQFAKQGDPGAAQQQSQQMQQQLQQAQQMIQELQGKANAEQTKLQIAQLQIQSSEKIAWWTTQANLAKIADGNAQAALDAQIAQQNQAHEAAMGAASANHDSEMAQLQHQHSLEASDQGHAQDLQAQQQGADQQAQAAQQQPTGEQEQ